MLNGKAKIMTDFGDKKTQEANRTTIKTSENFKDAYSPQVVTRKGKLKPNASFKSDTNAYSKGRILT
jgi:hypothetical protein|tara:strand:+ start:357 stop:557 length:201 start_codon:yes stop_codon:yes gene_type:complete